MVILITGASHAGKTLLAQRLLEKYKYSAAKHKSNLRNICGTFAAEGITISKYTRRNLDRIASGQTSY